jgi:hypothetical protein
MNALNVLCARVLPILSELDGLDVMIHRVLDDQALKNLDVLDAQTSKNLSVPDELLFQGVPNLMNPNEPDGQCENCLVLSCA